MPRLDSEDRQRLAEFLGVDGSLPELNRMLCAGIRTGRYDADFDGVAEIVLAQTVDKLTIVRPDRLDATHRQAAQRAN